MEHINTEKRNVIINKSEKDKKYTVLSFNSNSDELIPQFLKERGNWKQIDFEALQNRVYYYNMEDKFFIKAVYNEFKIIQDKGMNSREIDESTHLME